jgi:glyoxylase I family protein
MAKPQITNIAVIFTVSDLSRTQRFYRDALGLQLEGGDGYLSIELPSGTELMFFEGKATPGGSPQIVFGLDDGGIDSVAERLAEQGVQLLTPVTEAPGGWSMELADPDQHPLALYQDGKLPRR